MKKMLFLIAAIAVSPAPSFAADNDSRQLVEMPDEARMALRAEMLDFQVALHSIIGALGERRFAEAANLAETQIGVSAMGRHRNSPANARPGMFMPNDMHAIARGMHVAGSEFAKIAKSGNTSKALVALQAVTVTCVACHRSYRTQ